MSQHQIYFASWNPIVFISILFDKFNCGYLWSWPISECYKGNLFLYFYVFRPLLSAWGWWFCRCCAGKRKRMDWVQETLKGVEPLSAWRAEEEQSQVQEVSNNSRLPLSNNQDVEAHGNISCNYKSVKVATCNSGLFLCSKRYVEKVEEIGHWEMNVACLVDWGIWIN